MLAVLEAITELSPDLAEFSSYVEKTRRKHLRLEIDRQEFELLKVDVERTNSDMCDKTEAKYRELLQAARTSLELCGVIDLELESFAIDEELFLSELRKQRGKQFIIDDGVFENPQLAIDDFFYVNNVFVYDDLYDTASELLNRVYRRGLSLLELKRAEAGAEKNDQLDETIEHFSRRLYLPPAGYLSATKIQIKTMLLEHKSWMRNQAKTGKNNGAVTRIDATCDLDIWEREREICLTVYRQVLLPVLHAFIDFDFFDHAPTFCFEPTGPLTQFECDFSDTEWPRASEGAAE